MPKIIKIDQYFTELFKNNTFLRHGVYMFVYTVIVVSQSHIILCPCNMENQV